MTLEAGRLFEAKSPNGLYIIEPAGRELRAVVLTLAGDLLFIAEGTEGSLKLRCEAHSRVAS